MRRFLTLSCALAALTLAAPAQAQEAPTPGEILGAASDRMLEITTNAGEAQQQVAAATVGRLETLAEGGASNERLAFVARRGVSTIRDVAGAARSALNRTSARAAGALDAIGAPEPFFQALRDLRAAAGERLRHTTRECSRVIVEKLQELAGDDEITQAA
jgi:hypothetical protein